MKDNVPAAEWYSYNGGILQEYLRHTQLSAAEFQELVQWVNTGHCVHGDNPWGLYNDRTHRRLDFIPAFRLHTEEQNKNMGTTWQQEA